MENQYENKREVCVGGAGGVGAIVEKVELRGTSQPALGPVVWVPL